MKKTIFLFLTICLFVLCLPANNGLAIAQTQNKAVATPPKINPGDIEKTLKILENPKEAKQLASQLKLLLEAQQRVEKNKAKPKPTLSSNLFKLYEYYKNQWQRNAAALVSQIETLPLSYQRFQVYLSKRENWQMLLSFCIKIVVAVLLGFVVWLLFRKATKAVAGRIQWREPAASSTKIGRALAATCFKIYPWVGIYFFALIFFWAVPIPEQARLVILYDLLLIILYQVLKSLANFSLSPDMEERRIFPLSTATAFSSYLWIRRVLLFSLWMFLIILPASVLHQQALSTVMSGIYRVGLLFLLAGLLARWKASIEKTLSEPLPKDSPAWQTNAKRMSRYLIGKLYFLALLYLGLVLILPLLGSPDIYDYILYSTLKSIGLLVLVFGIWLGWDLLLNRLGAASSNVTETYPDSAERVQRFVHLLAGTGHVVLIFFAILTLLDIWGLHIYAFMSRNAAMLQPLVHIPVIILVAILVLNMAEFFIALMQKRLLRQMLHSGKVSELEAEKRVSTLGSVFRKAALIAGEASKPIKVQLEGLEENREQLKKLISEVLDEAARKPKYNNRWQQQSIVFSGYLLGLQSMSCSDGRAAES